MRHHIWVATSCGRLLVMAPLASLLLWEPQVLCAAALQRGKDLGQFVNCRCPYTKIENHCRLMGTDISIPSRCVSISAKVIIWGDSNHWYIPIDNHQFQMIFGVPSFSETSINQTIVEITKDMSRHAIKEGQLYLSCTTASRIPNSWLVYNL